MKSERDITILQVRDARLCSNPTDPTEWPTLGAYINGSGQVFWTPERSHASSKKMTRCLKPSMNVHVDYLYAIMLCGKDLFFCDNCLCLRSV